MGTVTGFGGSDAKPPLPLAHAPLGCPFPGAPAPSTSGRPAGFSGVTAAPRTSCRSHTPRPLRCWAEPVRPEPRVVPEARTRPAGPRRGSPRSPEAGSPGPAGTQWGSVGGSQGTRVLPRTPCARSLPVWPSPEGCTAPHSRRPAGHAHPVPRGLFLPPRLLTAKRHARPPATPSDTGPVAVVSIGAGEALHSHLPASPVTKKSENTLRTPQS